MKTFWAFEPFHQETTKIKEMHRLLSLLGGKNPSIEIGFVATRTESSLNAAFDVPERERFSTYPRSLIKKELKSAKIQIEDKKIHVIDFPTLSSTKAVDRLLNLASDRGCDIIGLFTHRKDGYKRFAVGSFAETAIHRSKKSLLILNPQTKVAPKILNILYASDFGSSKSDLKEVIHICRDLKSKLTIFHHAEMTYSWSMNESSPKTKSYRQKVDQTKKWIEIECQQAGVECEVLVSSQFDPTSDLILKAAKKKKADMIITRAKVGRLAALMGGSITRQVLRGSEVPVLVLKS